MLLALAEKAVLENRMDSEERELAADLEVERMMAQEAAATARRPAASKQRRSPTALASPSTAAGPTWVERLQQAQLDRLAATRSPPRASRALAAPKRGAAKPRNTAAKPTRP